MLNWQILSQQYQTNTPFVLITVGKVQGSSPRETGAKMLVKEQQILGTIGGGNLEFFAIQHAQQLLKNAADNTISEHKTPLTPQYDQCCGGVVQLIFEKVNPKTSSWLLELYQQITNNEQAFLCLITDLKKNQRYIEVYPNQQSTDSSQAAPWLNKQNNLIEPITHTALPIIIFGIGHVGKALINLLQHLDVSINAIDSRADQLPKIDIHNVTIIHTEDWQTMVKQAPENAYFLVLTHSHKLDYQISEAILKKDQFHYFGLIGSKTKKIRFERQMLLNGIQPNQLTNMTCPIGLPSIQGKTPEIIAASVMAQILEISFQKNKRSSNTNQCVRIQHV